MVPRGAFGHVYPLRTVFLSRYGRMGAGMGEHRDFSDYEKLASAFCPKEGCAEEWCRLAKEAGARYAVLTTRHHEGFSLWDSKVQIP